VKNLASKSLLSQTSKSKKVDKYKETSEPTKFKYMYEVGSDAIYKGIIEEYRNTLCTITKRSHKNQNEYYTIKFALDDSELKDINGNILKNLEDHETELALDENNELSQNQEDDIDLSDEEIKVIANGYIPYKNKNSCFSPIDFIVNKNCDECLSHKNQCVYKKKYKYDKVKI